MLIVHVDSISDTSETVAPGADDNASGVAVLLETARILKEIPLERSIVFGAFTNEERCRRGSRSYVRLAKKDELNIKAVINLDILGYNRPAWPFYWDAVMAQNTLKHKVKAILKMARNYFLGMIYGKDVMQVAGRDSDQKLVTTTSKILREVSKLKVKEVVSDDGG
jgi:Zn-dependent M28 family amino/carboxypeptidase